MRYPKILPIWQPVGHSTHEISRLVSEKYGVKTSHTGTLDPMAEGVIIILLGEERFKKYEYAKWRKGYEFEMVFEINTDTYDGLGIPRIGIERSHKLKDLKNVLKGFKGKYSQIVPPFSSIKVKGKPLHWHARYGNLNNIRLPKREGEIYNIKLISLKEKLLSSIVKDILKRIRLVEGDFRQDEIIKKWRNISRKYKEGSQKSLTTAKMYVEMSKGLYVRSLSQDIAAKLGADSFVFSIKRVKNGKFTRQNSKLWMKKKLEKD